VKGCAGGVNDLNVNKEFEKEGRIKDFISQNKRLVVLLAILAVVIIVGISVNVWVNNANKVAEEELIIPEADIIEDQIAEILPKTERTVEGDELTTSPGSIPKDPFMGPMVLLGVITGGRDDNIAIIKSGNTTYVVKEGEQILDYWNLKAVNGDSAVLESDERETMLKLSGMAINSESTSATTSNTVSLDVRNADVRDVLSALAIKLNANVIYTEKPTNITLKVENVTSVRALEMVAQNLGYSYARQSGLYVVGSSNKLHSDFFNQMVLTRFNLIFIEAEIVEPLIGRLSLPVKSIRIPTNQQAIWIQGTPQAILKMQELINAIDRPENADDEEISLAYRSIWTNVISPSRVTELLSDAGMDVENYVILGSRLLVFDKDLFSRWEEIETLVRELDNMNASEYRVFAFALKNTVARDAAERLDQFDYEGVKTITFNYPQFGQEILVICPPHLESQVYSSLVSLDGNRKKIKAPITSATGENAKSMLTAKRTLLSELTDVSVKDMYLSENLSGDRDAPHYVLWIEETPDKIQYLNEMILRFDEK